MSAVLAALVAALVPEDELGPGAVGAGVLDFLERAFAGPLAGLRSTYERGLTALDELARSEHGRPFDGLDDAARDALLTEVEAGGRGEELQAFFDLVRVNVVHGMFADPAYGGNRDGAGWRLIGFPGPKTVFTERDQALGVDVEPMPLP